MPLELSFLGSPEVRLNGRAVTLPTRKAFALLTFLACEPGSHSREKLAAMFWPDNDETGGRTALRKALGFLNTALEVDQYSLKVTRDALGFEHGPNVQSDVLDLETAAKQARISEQADDSELRTKLEQVVDGLRGKFMAGFTLPESTDFEDWLDLRRESLRRDADAVLQRLSGLQANTGQVQVALVTARKRVALDTLNEAAHRTVIELHLRTGTVPPHSKRTALARASSRKNWAFRPPPKRKHSQNRPGVVNAHNNQNPVRTAPPSFSNPAQPPSASTHHLSDVNANGPCSRMPGTTA